MVRPRLAQEAGRRKLGWFVAIAAMGVAGFGIYIGRFLRWHSVDIFLNPFELFAAIADRVMHPLVHTRTWGVTLGFAVFLILAHLAARQMGRPKDTD